LCRILHEDRTDLLDLFAALLTVLGKGKP